MRKLLLGTAVVLAFGSAARAECNSTMLKINGLFIHATVECNYDFMDTPEGYYALAKARECKGMTEEDLKASVMGTFRNFDQRAASQGKQVACKWVHQVRAALHKDILGH